MNLALITFSVFLGGLASGFAGWLGSCDGEGHREVFDARKFGRSVFFALQSAMIWALALNSAQIAILDSKIIILAFYTGMGFDVFTNRTLGVLTSPTKTNTTSNTIINTDVKK